MKKKLTAQTPSAELAARRQAAMKIPAALPVEDEVETLIENVPTLSEPEKVNLYDYNDISTAPRNGTLIIVSETGEDKGDIVFWKKTRAFANATHRWEETGFFAGNISNLPISFVPKYWRTRSIYEV